MADDVKINVGMDTTNYDKGVKKIELTALQAAKASSSLNRQINSLRSSFKNGDISARQYGKAVVQLKNEFKLLQSGAQGSLLVMNQFGLQASRAQSKMKRFGAVGAQQVGYQLQDFAVQVQGGTNALVALGQQGSQLLGIFGPAGALAGAGLAIGTAILRPLLDASSASDAFMKNMEKTDEVVGDVEKAFDDLGGAVGRFSTDLDMINLSQFNDAMSEFGDTAGRSFNSGFRGTVGKYLFQQLYSNQSFSDFKAEEAGKNFAEAFGAGAKEMGVGVIDQFAEALSSGDALALEDLLRELSAHLDNATSAGKAFFEQMSNALEKQYLMDYATSLVEQGLIDTTSEAIKLVEEYGQATVKALVLEGVDLSKPLSDATEEAIKLAAQYDILIGKAFQLLANEEAARVASIGGGRGMGPGGALIGSSEYKDMVKNNPGMQLSAQEQALAAARFKASQEASKKGGRSSLSEEERAIKKIFDSTRTDAELLAAGLKELDKFLIDDEISADTYGRALKDLNERYDETTRYAMELSREFQDNLSSAFFSVVDGSKSAGDALMGFVNNVLRKIAEQQFNDRIGGPLADALGDIISGFGESSVSSASTSAAVTGSGGVYAKGGIFDQSGVHAFAKGGIVNSPTLFPFAKGTGLMGEAGPEAIMPLSRGKDGKLGVSGGGTKVIINNYSNERAESQQNSNGDLVVTIGRAVAADITGGGPSYRAIKNTFGLNQPMQRRG